MLWRYLFCACLLTIAAGVMAEASRKNDTGKKHVQLKRQSLTEMAVLNLGKRRNLFSRRGHRRRHRPLAPQHAVKPRVTKAPSSPPEPPAQRCPRVMESCMSHKPCCDPCASCRCRFFSSICYCRRLGRHCEKKS